MTLTLPRLSRPSPSLSVASLSSYIRGKLVIKFLATYIHTFKRMLHREELVTKCLKRFHPIDLNREALFTRAWRTPNAFHQFLVYLQYRQALMNIYHAEHLGVNLGTSEFSLLSLATSALTLTLSNERLTKA